MKKQLLLIIMSVAALSLSACKRDRASASPLHTKEILHGTWHGTATVSGNQYDLIAHITDLNGSVSGRWNTYHTQPGNFLLGNGEMDPHSAADISGTFDGNTLRATISGTCQLLDAGGTVTNPACAYSFSLTGVVISGDMDATFTGDMCGTARNGTATLSL